MVQDTMMDHQLKYKVRIQLDIMSVHSLALLLRTEIGKFVHAVEGEMLCASTNASKVRFVALLSQY